MTRTVDALRFVFDVEAQTTKLAGVPLNLTAFAPVRLLPVRMTSVPGGPLVGANELRVGAGVVVPPEVVK